MAKPGERQGPQVLGRRRVTRRAPTIEPRDFRRPTRAAAAGGRGLQEVALRFAARMRLALANYLRLAVEGVARAPEALVFSNAVERAAPAAWWIPMVSARGERVIVVLDERLQGYLIPRLLGWAERPQEDASGTDEAADAPQAASVPLGAVSRAALRPFVATLMREVNLFLREDQDAPFTLDEERRDVQRTRMMRANDRVTRFAVELREGSCEVGLELIVPSDTLATLVGAEDAARPVARPESRPGLERLVRSLEMEVRARLGRAVVPMQELIGLAPGDVLVLDRRVDEPLELRVGDRARFLARPGRSRGRLAVRVLGPLDPEETK